MTNRSKPTNQTRPDQENGTTPTPRTSSTRKPSSTHGTAVERRRGGATGRGGSVRHHPSPTGSGILAERTCGQIPLHDFPDGSTGVSARAMRLRDWRGASAVMCGHSGENTT